MKILSFKTPIEGVLMLQPEVYRDDRGFFLQTFHHKAYEELGITDEFVQDNSSHSSKNVIRGLHYQAGEHAQGKLVSVSFGDVYDVVVDLRKSSPTYGQHAGFYLCAKLRNQLWVPAGCAHGFMTVTDTADFNYKCTNYYEPRAERTLLWNDSTLNIDWPLFGNEPIVSDKDKLGKTFEECEKYEKI